MLGIGFYHDLQVPWAEKVLTDKNILSEEERYMQLYEKSFIHLHNALKNK